MKENYSVARTLNFFFTKVHVLCRRQIRLLSVKFKHITPVLGDFHWLRRDFGSAFCPCVLLSKRHNAVLSRPQQPCPLGG